MRTALITDGDTRTAWSAPHTVQHMAKIAQHKLSHSILFICQERLHSCQTRERIADSGTRGRQQFPHAILTIGDTGIMLIPTLGPSKQEHIRAERLQPAANKSLIIRHPQGRLEMTRVKHEGCQAQLNQKGANLQIVCITTLTHSVLLKNSLHLVENIDVKSRKIFNMARVLRDAADSRLHLINVFERCKLPYFMSSSCQEG